MCRCVKSNSGCLQLTKCFRKIRLESKSNNFFCVVPAENFREQRHISNDSPVFPDGIFDGSFRLSRPFVGKWNWFVQMVNAIPGSDLPLLNFAYHLTKPSTHRFADLNGKQPLLVFKTSRNTKRALQWYNGHKPYQHNSSFSWKAGQLKFQQERS